MPGGSIPADRVDACAGLATTLGGLNLGAAEGGSSSREPGPSSSSAAPGQGRAVAVSAPAANRPGLLTCQVLSCLTTTGENGTPLLTCAGCGYVAYCCKDHQKRDWSFHKLFCKNAGKDGPLAPNIPNSKWMTEGMTNVQLDRWSAACLQITTLLGTENPAEYAVQAKVVLANLESFFGRGHLGTVFALGSVTDFFMGRAMYDDALSYSLRALKIVEDRYGPDDAKTAYFVNTYASVISGMGRKQEALVQWQRCLKINESARGLNSNETASDLNNVATMLGDLGRTDEAVSFIRRALAIKTALLGAANHSDNIVVSRTNLACSLGELGRFDEARPLFEAALKSTELTKGRNTVNYARISASYASVMRSCEQGDQTVIAAMVEHAIDVFERMHGERDLEFIMNLELCAQANADLGRWRRAADQMDRCAKLISDEFGPGHARTKDSRELAALYKSKR